ncbi:MAG TPA: DUF1800 domain-containing protein [Solirubrobacteraceae bacterium]
MSRVPRYRGPFGPDEARRLLWRAGFGPRPGQAERLAKHGLDRAVHSLTHPRSRRLKGPRPVDEDHRPLAPRDAWGHDHCWWLDRMVRSEAPLVERMTLVWHDWFATSKDGATQGLMLRQNALLRRHALGSFERLAVEITRDPAMLLWLNGVDNRKDDVNENYARELMELFTLGAGRGYTERDVREMARALTGFRSDWSDGAGPHNFRYERESHDNGVKRIHGKRGRFDWRDAVRLSVRHRKHPSFLVNKLWGYFIPTPPPRGTARALERLYVAHGRNVRPLLDAILRHPHLYDRDRRMVKPPVVQAAGMLRAAGRGIDTTAWSWLCAQAGQMLFEPPNVSGWDDTRWLDTATFRARWEMAIEICNAARLEDNAKVSGKPPALVGRAAKFWHTPLSRPTRAALERYARSAMATADEPWKRESYPALTENALRMLVAVSPDYLTS